MVRVAARRMASKLHLALLLSACVVLGGCARIERARQCRAVVATVNPALDGIQELVATNRRDAAFYEDVAVRYEGLAARLEALALPSPEVKLMVDEYRLVLSGAARAIRSVGLAQTDPQRLPQARTELERVVRREKVIVLKLDAECHAP